MELFLIFTGVLLLIFLYFLFKKPLKKRRILSKPFPEVWGKLLEKEVSFYNKLSPGEQGEFRRRVQLFLGTTTIAGVGTDIDEKIKVLVAASAIIPVFRFKDWDYFNLEEVLIYPGQWSREDTDEKQKNFILGQVRSFQNNLVLRLSKPALLQGFKNDSDRSNVGIHEFAHMVDYADGSVDGRPQAFFPKELWECWVKLMHKEIRKIKKGKSDINPYGATSDAEFFAVVTEYFFERPSMFKSRHPQLYKLLRRIFRG